MIKEATNDEKNSCQPCATAFNAVNRAVRRKSKASAEPAKSKASLAACGAEKLRATVQVTRLECKQLRDRLKHLQTKIEKEGVGISASLETDLLKIMGGQNLESTPHMKFFWEQQMTLLQSNKMERRYHPQVIRFALSIHGKSPSACRELRDSGALILPSERVLRDYKNYFKPKAGINKENIECLREKTKHFTDLQRYVVHVMDEMKIQSNLVFDKVSGDLVGFVDLGDPVTNETFAEEESMATHALAFLVRGLCTDMKHIVSYYFTRDVTSFQIIPIFWKAVAVLELSLNLWVVATVNDGASANRKFFRLHSPLAKDLKCDVVYIRHPISLQHHALFTSLQIRPT
jgi:DNA-directed RNA polymerase subunit M/transcription elongation factor TFIIS